METTIKIEGSNCMRFDNALHAQFHRSISMQVGSVTKTKINVSDALYKEWTDSIDLEVEINREVQASVETTKMVAADKQRDDLISYLLSTVEADRQMMADLVTQMTQIIAQTKATFNQMEGIRKANKEKAEAAAKEA